MVKVVINVVITFSISEKTGIFRVYGRLRGKDNEYDKEAIKVIYEGLGKIGYVANSSYTVLGDSMSAGRIYDKIGKKAKAKVVLVTEHGTICSISKKSLLDNQKKVKKSETEVEE